MARMRVPLGYPRRSWKKLDRAVRVAEADLGVAEWLWRKVQRSGSFFSTGLNQIHSCFLCLLFSPLLPEMQRPRSCHVSNVTGGVAVTNRRARKNPRGNPTDPITAGSMAIERYRWQFGHYLLIFSRDVSDNPMQERAVLTLLDATKRRLGSDF
ncbi:hypothetical protein HDV63DRAFT_187292 [Trichoderma sp. SZMC 28014]